MMRCTTYSLAAVLSIQSVGAFAPAAATNAAARAAPSTAVNLVPEQSRQLVAFSQDYFAKKAKESASKASQLSSPRRSRNSFTAVATNLMTRLVGKESRSNDEVSPPTLTHAHHADGEVIYPIVGSCLVEGRALPSADQVTACNLPLLEKEEEVYGFWTTTQGGDSLWM
mmetsp:Transcript_6870/g.11232  ORF Transcript_6870/g.11232 Transcript_6870/m.11232 type:complete len:169 (+) Transcript_6870:222-728(+)|eukprot:scaffold1680_cov139-Skeletonema_menzelii.AAC.7